MSLAPRQSPRHRAVRASVKPTLREFAAAGYQAARPQRPTSYDQILLSIDLLELWAGREVHCDELNRELLLSFRQWRIEERPLPVCPKHGFPMRRVRGRNWRCKQRGCCEKAIYLAPVKPATANGNIRVLNALWYEAVDQSLNREPKKRIKRLNEELDNLRCWTLADLAKMLAAAKLEPDDTLMPCAAADFWTALLNLCYDTASRIKALLRATPADLDLVSGTITLRSKTTKGKKCDVKTLRPATLDALRKIYDPELAYLLPWLLKPNALRARLRRILKRAGLPHTGKDLFHKIRRTTLTQVYIKSGGKIEVAQRYGNHSDPSVTRRYIDQTQIDETRKAAELLPDLEAG